MLDPSDYQNTNGVSSGVTNYINSSSNAQAGQAGGGNWMQQAGSWLNSDSMGQGMGMSGMNNGQMILAADQMGGQIFGMLAGQNETKAGNIIKKVPGLSTIGNFVNAAFGSNINEDFVNQTNYGINSLGSRKFNSKTNADVLNDWRASSRMSHVDKSDVGSDGWFSNKAENKTNSLNEDIDEANKRQLINFGIAVNNADKYTDLRILGGMQAAYGGPINSFRKYYADGGNLNTPQFFSFEPQVYSKGGYLNQAKALIRQNEGWSDKPYRDAPKGKNWRSVGYGFNDSGFREKYPEGISKHYEHGITKKQAEEELNYFLNKAEKNLKSIYGKQWNDFTDSQKAAILDTYYQRPASVGKGSRFYKAVTAGEDAGKYLGVAGFSKRNKIRQGVFSGSQDYVNLGAETENPNPNSSTLQEVTPFTPVVHDLDLSGITPTQAKALELNLASPVFDLSMFNKPSTPIVQQQTPAIGTVEDFLASYGDFEENLFGDGGFASLVTTPVLPDIKEIRHRLYNGINPAGYQHIPERIWDALNKKEANRSIYRDDQWATYLQIPEEEKHSGVKKLQSARYRPSIGNTNGDVYRMPLDEKDTDVLIQRAQLSGLGLGKNMVDRSLAHYFGDHTVGRGHDKKGEYISYYDKYDLNPFTGGTPIKTGVRSLDKWLQTTTSLPNIDLSLGIGKPFEIYDRIYLDDYYGVPKEARGGNFLPEITVTGKKKNKKAKGGHLAKPTLTNSKVNFSNQLNPLQQKGNVFDGGGWMDFFKAWGASQGGGNNYFSNMGGNQWKPSSGIQKNTSNGSVQDWLGVAGSAVNTISNWGKEDPSLGRGGGYSDFGMAAYDVMKIIRDATKDRKEPMDKKLGIPIYARGGRLFEGGGSMGAMGYAQIGLSALKLASNAKHQASLDDDIDRGTIDRSINRYGQEFDDAVANVNTNGDLLDLWQNNSTIEPNLTMRDFRDKSYFDDFLNGYAASWEGFNAGAQTGNPYVTAIAAVVGGASSNIASIIGRNKAEDAARETNIKIRKANERRIDSLLAAADRVDKENDYRILQNMGANGGKLNMGFGLRNPFVMPDGTANPLYKAFGGALAHEMDWDTGINWVNEGGSHGENPLGGVPMGVDEQGIPNLVEEGEAIWNGDYVFSKRMKVPKKLREKYKLPEDATFADAVAKLTKNSEERPLSVIDRNTQDHILGEFSDTQEEMRAAKAQRAMEKQQQLQDDFLMGMQFGLGGHMSPMGIVPDSDNLSFFDKMENAFADGGGIHIDPSKKGTFKAQASKMGMGVQEAASHILAHKENYSPAMVKKANFARNASHWHEDGGYLVGQVYDLDEVEVKRLKAMGYGIEAV